MAITDLIPWRKKVPVKRERDVELAPQWDVDRLFDEWWNGFGLTPTEELWAAFSPRVDVSETDQALTVQAELPGLSEDDFGVTLSGHTLTLKGEKREDKEERGKNYYRAERTHGSFRRAIQLPQEVNLDEANAEFKRGVLTITFPKRETSSKRIVVKTKES